MYFSVALELLNQELVYQHGLELKKPPGRRSGLARVILWLPEASRGRGARFGGWKLPGGARA